jgi:myo-inositol-1(or 4)-monophosphatase
MNSTAPRLPEIREWLELSKSAAMRVGARFAENFRPDHKNYRHCRDNPKEIKSLADAALDKDILRALSPIGLPILSEESGSIPGRRKSPYSFIVDPLDGTFNFVKGLGPSAVSIALWKNREPIFGVIYELVEKRLYWGGRGMGAHAGDKKLAVSGTSRRDEASLCTGFPARHDMSAEGAMKDFWRKAQRYAKVRMLGSAAVSLLHVAKGSADAYSEDDIMLWDVAAGLALVEGAGGRVRFTPGAVEHSLSAFAGNGVLPDQREVGA